MRTHIWLVLVLLSGCDLFEVGEDSGLTSSTGPTGTEWTPETGAWSGATHPCVGNRTDAMVWTDASTVLVGCGSTVIGTGLYRSADAGDTWSQVSPVARANFRVSSLQSIGGSLLVGGIDTESRIRVVSLDGADQPTTVFEAGDQVWNSFHVGTYRENNDGVAVAESLTGTGLVWRPTADVAFEDGSTWPTDGASYQILDLEVHANRFTGVGSTIGTPPHVFLPAGTSPFALEPVQLADWNGELWSVDVDGGGVIAGGVDQQANVGVVFSSAGPAPEDASTFRELRLDTLVGDSPSWVRGVCRSGTLLAAVGEFSQRADPILLVSADNGNSWNDWTAKLPGSPGALHQCELWTDGRLAVTGQDGYFALWTP